MCVTVSLRGSTVALMGYSRAMLVVRVDSETLVMYLLCCTLEKHVKLDRTMLDGMLSDHEAEMKCSNIC